MPNFYQTNNMTDSPYFLRPKRRKLNTGTENYDFYISPPTRRKNVIMRLPTEVLLLVFKNLSFKDLGLLK